MELKVHYDHRLFKKNKEIDKNTGLSCCSLSKRMLVIKKTSRGNNQHMQLVHLLDAKWFKLAVCLLCK